MGRIQELEQKYPTLPRDVIIKWEMESQGVVDTADLDLVSDWKTAEGSYQSKFDAVSLKELVGTSSRLRNGQMLRPRSMLMKSSIGVALHIDPKSRYSIRGESEDKLALYEGEDKIDVKIYFPRVPAREGPEPVTSKGSPISRFMKSPRNCFNIQAVRYCEYFSTGEQCKFCNFNTSQDDARGLGLNRPVNENLDEVIEGYKIRGSEVHFIEGRWELGGFPNSDIEDKIHINFAERLSAALPYKPNFTIHTQATSRKTMQRLRDAGLNCMTLQMEIWEPEMFAEALPGKARHASFERWMESISDAVDVFGGGNVSVKSIGGLSLIPYNGHKTWQEARDSHIEHVKNVFKLGAFSSVGYLGLPPGTVYGSNPANREKLPPTEYYLDVIQAHHQAMMETKFYEKLNRLMYCGLCCVAVNYCGEVTILETAGNWGDWMVGHVPEKANWLKKFLDAVNTTAPATPAGG
ncbi:MAG: radical SAM protein [Dehalococcoidia bacterium]|nr:radical SAM protein [Dehalococcoidia bacterium]